MLPSFLRKLMGQGSEAAHASRASRDAARTTRKRQRQVPTFDQLEERALLSAALWTDKPTSIGRLMLEPSQWIHFLYVETEERLSASANAVSSASPPPPSPVAEQPTNNPFTSAPEVEGKPSA